MPRGQYARKPKAEGTAIVKSDLLASQSWWKKLTPQEQTTVTHEGQALAQSMLQFGRSRLAIGEHLEKLRGVLEPHNVFQKFLKGFHFSKRTAYRYIAGYANAKARLPESVLQAAMARGVQIIGESEQAPLGVYTQAAAALPPPKEATTVQANAWLDAIEQQKKQARSSGEVTAFAITPGDPNTLMKECLRFVSTRYKRLPSNKRTRDAWVRQLVGMELAEFGIGAPQTFTPVAVPEQFQVHRGRPKVAASA